MKKTAQWPKWWAAIFDIKDSVIQHKTKLNLVQTVLKFWRGKKKHKFKTKKRPMYNVKQLQLSIVLRYAILPVSFRWFAYQTVTTTMYDCIYRIFYVQNTLEMYNGFHSYSESPVFLCITTQKCRIKFRLLPRRSGIFS